MPLMRASTNSSGARSLISRLSAMLGVTLLIAGGLMLADVQSATAAYRSDIIDPTSLVLTIHPDAGPTLEVYDWVSLTGSWSIPNATPATAGDTFSLTLPPQFQPTSSVSFPLVDPADPTIVYANCSFPGAAPYVLTCVFTSEVEGKQDVGGTFAVWLVAIQNTSETSVEFEVGASPVVVQLPGQGVGVCPGICDPDFGDAPTVPSKFGHVETNGDLLWRIQFPNSSGVWTVSDVLTSTSPAPAHFVVPNYYQVRRILASEWQNQGTDGSGFVSVLGDAVITPDAATPNVTAFQIDFSGSAGDYIYWVEYRTRVLDPYEVGAVFNNTATVSGTVLEASIEVAQGGNGTGSGVTTTTSTTVPETTTSTTIPETTTSTTIPETTTSTTIPVTTTSTTIPVTTTSTTVAGTTLPPDSTTTSEFPVSGGPTVPQTSPTVPSSFPPAPLPVTGSSTTLPLLMMALGLAFTGSALLTSRRPS